MCMRGELKEPGAERGGSPATWRGSRGSKAVRGTAGSASLATARSHSGRAPLCVSLGFQGQEEEWPGHSQKPEPQCDSLLISYTVLSEAEEHLSHRILTVTRPLPCPVCPPALHQQVDPPSNYTQCTWLRVSVHRST